MRDLKKDSNGCRTQQQYSFKVLKPQKGTEQSTEHGTES